MNFLADAHLPQRIASWLRDAGHDAVHTLDLPEANCTTDTTILGMAAQEQRVVVTKHADSVDSFVLRRQPEKLLLISTGNITNADLEALLRPNLEAIVAALAGSDLVEVTQNALIVHS